MSDHEQQRRLDELLDSMLSTYSAVEPRPGLELRIHAHLKAHAGRRLWGFALVLAASTAVIVSAWLARRPAGQREPIHQEAHFLPRAQMLRVSPAVRARIAPAATPRVFARRLTTDQTRALLQIAEASRTNNALVLDDTDGPAAVADELEPPVATQNKPFLPQPISIRDLAVDSLEIKELAPSREDEKGNL